MGISLVFLEPFALLIVAASIATSLVLFVLCNSGKDKPLIADQMSIYKKYTSEQFGKTYAGKKNHYLTQASNCCVKACCICQLQFFTEHILCLVRDFRLFLCFF